MRKIRRCDYENAITYFLCFFLLIISVRAETVSGLKPLGLAMFAAMVYSRKNIILLAPMYLIANLISEFTWQSAVVGAVPSALFIAAYFIHNKSGKRMSLTAINIYTFLAQVPVIVFGVLRGDYINIAFNALLTQVFAYVAIIAFYTVSIRGLRYKLTFDEVLCLLVTSAAISLSLYGIGYQNFRLFYLFFPFAVMFAVYNFPMSSAMFFYVAAGLGCALSGGGLVQVAVTVIIGTAATAFKNTKPAFAAVALTAASAIIGYYFEMQSGYGYINLIAVALGAAVFLALPVRYKKPFVDGAALGGGRTGKTVVGENRRDTSLKLYSLASVFEEMQNLLQGGPIAAGGAPYGRKIAKDVALSYCAHCDNSGACFSSLGGDTSQMLESVVEGCLRKGKATIIDMPPFITSRCRKINGLIQTINEKADEAKKYEREEQSVDRGRQMLAVQMGGVAEILDNLADDYKKPVSFDGARERLIAEELTYHNIACKEVMVYGMGGDINVAVTIDENDADKAVLIAAVSKIMKVRLIKVDEVQSGGGNVTVHLSPSPRYDIVYGEAFIKKKGENISGDSRFIRRVAGNKMIIAVSDGMGTGESAEKEGSRAALMVENFYQAGFSNDVVATLANRLLAAKSDENFSALDLAAIDLTTGACDFMKLGATYTVIKHGENIEIIEGRSLPVGVLDAVKPDMTRRILSSGDVLLIFSDGITDSIDRADLCAYLSEYKGNNPEMLAADILRVASDGGADDDMTVLAARIFSRV